MFSSEKTAKLNTQNHTFFKKRLGSLLSIFAVTVVGVLIGSQSIMAGISDIYDEKNDQVAGINSLMSAVTNNDIDGVRFFSKAGSVLINQKNLGGATALHIACRESNFEIAKILVESGADVNAADNEGWTPLMRASLSAEKNIVELLLSKEARANEVNSVNESAIIQATSSDCNECLKLMFEKYNFIKLMDTKVLKNQLNEAFVIAGSHDNQVAQTMIEGYLDSLIKMLPLMTKDEVKQSFKFNDEDSSSMISKEEDKRSVVTKDVPSNKAEVETETTAAKIESNSGVRFKFVTGSDGQSPNLEKEEKISVQKKETVQITKSDHVIYKFTGASTSNKVGASKVEEGASAPAASVAQEKEATKAPASDGFISRFFKSFRKTEANKVESSKAEEVDAAKDSSTQPAIEAKPPVKVFKFKQGEAAKVSN